MIIDLVGLYILICKLTENKEIENMVRLDNVHNMLTLGGGYLETPILCLIVLQRKHGKI